MDYSLGHEQGGPAELKSPGEELASALSKKAFVEGCNALADGNSQISADLNGLMLKANAIGELRVVFTLRPGVRPAYDGLLGHAMQVQAPNGEPILSCQLSPQSWTKVLDSFNSGRQSEFLALISDPWPQVTDRWIKWEQFDRIIVPWLAIERSQAEESQKPSTQHPAPSIFRLPSDGELFGGRAPRLNNWVERGFWSVVDGFPVTLTAGPGLVAPNERIKPGFLTRDGGILRIWSPSLEEIFNHIIGRSSYLEQMKSRESCQIIDRKGAQLLERLRRNRRKLG